MNKSTEGNSLSFISGEYFADPQLMCMDDLIVRLVIWVPIQEYPTISAAVSVVIVDHVDFLQWTASHCRYGDVSHLSVCTILIQLLSGQCRILCDSKNRTALDMRRNPA